MTKLIAYSRRNAIAIAALFLALSGGYAIAASTAAKTITACANKRTGELFLSTHGRCTNTQQKVAWDQEGPQGIPGMTGATGPAGAAPPSAWALVSNNGVADPSNGLTATHVSAGTYQITVTAPACADKQNAPVVTLSDSNPPGGQTAGAFPVAWVGVEGFGPTFMVYTGDVVNGTFTPSDH
ncbi:MAG: hypothetical protein ACLP50_32170, partial [Solirubrobacteraceae bacterium]